MSEDFDISQAETGFPFASHLFEFIFEEIDQNRKLLPKMLVNI